MSLHREQKGPAFVPCMEAGPFPFTQLQELPKPVLESTKGVDREGPTTFDLGGLKHDLSSGGCCMAHGSLNVYDPVSYTHLTLPTKA